MNNKLNFSNNYFRNNVGHSENHTTSKPVYTNNKTNNTGSSKKKKASKQDNGKLVIVMVAVIAVVFLFIFLSGNKEDKTPVVHNIIMDTSNAYVSINNTFKLNAYVENNPLATITWYSNNPNIASVDQNGIVKGLNYGETLIYASYVDSNNETKTCFSKVKVGSGNKDVAIESIAFPEGEILIKVGDTYNVPYSITPNDGYLENISYKSDNTSIVTVDEKGLIKAVSVGVTDLYLFANNNKFQSSIKVNVVNMETNPQIVVLPNVLNFVEKEISLLEGNTKDVELYFEPSNAKVSDLTYTSSNDGICYVSNNEVVAVTSGTCNIEVKSINGKTDILKVNVVKQKVDVTSLKVTSNSTINLKVGETSTITYKVEPSDATDKSVTFTSGNTNIATVSKLGVVTAEGKGTTTITVKTVNNKEVTLVVNVTKEESGSTCDEGPSGLLDTLTPLTSLTTMDQFNSCRSVSPNLILTINGTTYQQDSTYDMKVGDTITVKCNLPTKCGGIMRLTRTSADGQSGWSTYFSMQSSPYVNRCDYTTFKRVTSYDWKITAKKATSGYVTLSQTAQFDVKNNNNQYGNIKSMIRLKVRVTN